jgi:iron complex outermembrane receptor protein
MGEENLFFYNEETVIPLGFNGNAGQPCNPAAVPAIPGCTAAGTITTGSSLAAVNQAFGYLAADGTILNPQRLLVNGVPTSISLWRQEKRKDDDITWRINLDWTPTDNNLIYVSATKGSRSGGFNLVFFSAERTFKTESLISYEVGYKGTLLDGTLQVNTAAYLYDYKNVETFGTGPSAFNPANTSTSVFSVPSAQIIGWDVDANWLVTDNLTLGANFNYTHSEYTDNFTVNDPNDPSRPPSLFDPLSIPIDLDGKQMLQVPEMKAGAFAQYSWPMGDRGNLTFLVSWTWIDQVYFSAFESKEDAAPSYQRTDARIGWTSPGGSWNVAGFVNNVFDEIGLRQVDHYGAIEELDFRRWGSNTIPRQFGFEVDYKFGALK